MIESVLVALLALLLDGVAGDPRTRFHPTAWLGRIAARIIPYGRTGRPGIERLYGAVCVVILVSIPIFCLYALFHTVGLIPGIAGAAVTVGAGAILLKTTIAMRGMDIHAMRVVDSVESGDMESARVHLSMIVKRDTAGLDSDHVLSGVLESVSENTVDGITGPLFYFGLFGLFGAFAYRMVNTLDSMVGYRSTMFIHLGWAAAYCDRTLNYIPARLTALVMVLSSLLLGRDWRGSYRIVARDSSKLSSPNAGYPMAALAGALGTTLEKVDHYTIGDGRRHLAPSDVRASISLMRLTSVLFCCMVTLPLIAALGLLGWWVHV